MRAGKYALLEVERRFVVDGPLPELDLARAGLIVDRYLVGTRLRLRRLEGPAGDEVVLKLAQKIADPAGGPGVAITNLYLSPEEFELLATLPARELRKRRYPVDAAGATFAVDAFEGPLAGLVLAEVELGPDADPGGPLDVPSWLGREVTADVRFTGGALAALDVAAARALVAGL